MIRWLTKTDWKDYIENRTELGKYISHSLYNANEIEPAVDNYNFSNAIVKVTFKESGSNEVLDLYFDNSGPIKFSCDDYELGNQAVEFNFLYYQPTMVSEIMQFIELMSEKFGETYRTRRILHAYNEIELVNNEYKLLLSELHEKYMLFGSIKTDMSKLISKEALKEISSSKILSKIKSHLSKPNEFYKDCSLFDYDDQLPYPIKGRAKNISRNKMDELVDFVIHEEVTNLSEEKEFMEDYKYYQESLIYFITSLDTKNKDGQTNISLHENNRQL